MINNIINYKPLLKIIMEDGDTYYLSSDKENALLEDLNSKKFIKIKGDIIRTRDIKKVIPHNSTGLDALNKEDRAHIERRIKEYRGKFAEYPPEKQIQHWINTELNI